MSKRRCNARRGFTLVEALVSTTIMAIAGSALLLGLSTSLETSQLALEQTIGLGMAQQLLDEIAAKRYHAIGVSQYQTPLGPSASEIATAGRRYDDLDDFHGVRTQPATDSWGIQLGKDNGQGGQRHTAVQASSFFSNWRQEVDVYYVSPTDLSVRLPVGQTSDYRAAEVRIFVSDPIDGLRPVTTLRRVFAYVPGP